MDTKKANYISIVFIVVLGLVYLIAANSYKSPLSSATLGPDYFPRILAIILFILCAISFIQTIVKKEIEVVSFPNFKLVLLTLVLTAVFFISWSYFGYFYLHLFCFLLILFTYFTNKGFTRKVIFKNTIISFSSVVVIYILFDWIMKIRL